MTSSTTTSRSLTRGRKSSAPIGGREGPTGYDVSPIAIYVSKGRLCARLPYCPHRGWVSQFVKSSILRPQTEGLTAGHESQPSRRNMARYREIPYQDGSRGYPGKGVAEAISACSQIIQYSSSHRRHTRQAEAAPQTVWRHLVRCPRLLGVVDHARGRKDL